jgi:ABC-type transporter Mla subunit MlaD
MHITDDSNISIVAHGLSRSAREKLEKMARDLSTLEKRFDRTDAAFADLESKLSKIAGKNASALAELEAQLARNAAELAAANARIGVTK